MPAPTKPLIIAHRGASGTLPEHTLEAYRLAIDQGADFIEPDLVSTKDGALIARHENEISGTTDVALKFPKRKKTKVIDGQTIEGWFTEDLTLAEVKTLRAKERLAFRDQSHNGQFLIPTFQEILELVQKENAQRQLKGQTPLGIYPETKHPTYFRKLKIPLEPTLLKLLTTFGYTDRQSPIFIQSFETSNLKELSQQTQIRLVQLLDDPDLVPFDLQHTTNKTYRDLATPEGLKEIRTYASGVGPNKRYVLPVDSNNKLRTPSNFVGLAHDAGLVVHVWTLRKEAEFLHSDYGGRFDAEFSAAFAAGVDGVFTDFPEEGVRARNALVF